MSYQGSSRSAPELATPGHAGLVEALELCLLLAEKEPAKFERAALRWHARYCAETNDVVGTEEAQAVLSLLALIPRKRGAPSAAALAHLIGQRRGQERAAEALLRLSERRAR